MDNRVNYLDSMPGSDNDTEELLKIFGLEKNTEGNADYNTDNFLGDGNDEELRTVFIYMIYDISRSMNDHSQTMYDSFISTCKALDALQNEDYNYRVKLIMFNDDVHELSKEFQPPKDIKALVSEKDFACSGCTSLGKIISYLDSQFNRESMKSRHLHTGDPMSLVVMVTDYRATDPEEIRKKATKQIRDNRFYNKANKTLCVFCGADKDKADAAELAGSPDNIVALGDNISKLLTPVLIQSTITLSNATHIAGSNMEKTTSEIAKGIVDRNEGQDTSSKAMNNEQLKDELLSLLCNN